MKRFLATNAVVGALAAASMAAPPARAADFYAAKHLARFIPGAPTVVVQNMPGAGSSKAAAYIYSIAPKDGTTIGALMPGAIIDPLLQKHSTGGFDATKFTYLASADSDARICVTGPSSKITTFDQAMSQ